MIHSSDPSASSSEPTVLLVDDEPLFASSVEDALRARVERIRVFRASNGRAALAILDSYKIDLVVTDVGMPEMGGRELMAEMSRRGLDVAAIVVTADSASETEAFMRSAGAVAFIEKPVDLGSLVCLVVELIASHESGKIRGLSLPGFIQLLAAEQKSCTLRIVANQRTGTMTFVNGDLVDASLRDQRGEAAAMEICRWRDTTIFVQPTMTPRGRTVNTPVMRVLLESARLEDEEGRSARSLIVAPSIRPPEEDVFELGPFGAASPASRRSPSRQRLEAAAITGLEASLPTSAVMLSRDEERTMASAVVEHDLSESRIQALFDQAMQLEGVISVSLVNHESGIVLGKSGGGPTFNIELASAGNVQVLRTKMRVVEALGLRGGIEDIFVTTPEQYHLIKPMGGTLPLFLYLAVDRTLCSLGMARSHLAAIQTKLFS